MQNDLQRVLIGRDTIAQRVKELGADIANDYRGKELLAVGILKGAVVFYADLMRAMDIPVQVDFLAVSSYGQSTASSGVVRIIKDLERDVAGKHILLVEDIIDTGLTLSFLKENMLARGALSVKVCALLDKFERRKTPLSGEYVGFSIPNAFVVGYGLDYAERYRNLPDVCVLKPEIYQKSGEGEIST